MLRHDAFKCRWMSGSVVWLVVRMVVTSAATGKVKRIRNSGRVMLAPCTVAGNVVGPQVEGKASILSDQEEIARAVAAFASKHGIPFRLIAFLQGLARFLRRRTDDTVYLAIVP